MDNSQIISFLTVIFIFVCLLFSCYLLTVKTTNKTSNRLLAVFLLLNALDTSVFVYSDFITLHPSIEMVRIRMSIFKNPILFLYILSVIYADFKLKKKHLIHVVPFFISVSILTPSFFSTSTANQILYFETYLQAPEINFLLIFNNVLFVLYVLAIVFRLRHYRKILFENYTENISLLNYKWLSQLVIIIIIVALLTTIKDLSKYSFNLLILNKLRIVMLLCGITFISWLVLKSLYFSNFFTGIDPGIQLVKNLSKKSINPENEHNKNQIALLTNYMSTHEPFLDPALTIKKLSILVNIHEKELSILINHHLETHFFNFINNYRIEKAMILLKNREHKKTSIKEIMYTVGFNSKTPFNTAFKKHTKLTPSQFSKAEHSSLSPRY